jgi:hypothetical protein
MIPVDQEFIHKPEIGQHGDCQRAVIASLLGLPICDVPHFLHDGDSSEFWERIQSFLLQYDCQWMIMKKPDAGTGCLFFGTDDRTNIYHEISGVSPRDPSVRHAVVGCNGVIVHDPHPDKTGLAGTEDWDYGFLVKVR